jgi:hypothetical protein
MKLFVIIIIKLIVGKVQLDDGFYLKVLLLKMVIKLYLSI